MPVRDIETKLNMVTMLRTRNTHEVKRATEMLEDFNKKRVLLKNAQKLCDYCLQEQADIRVPIEQITTEVLTVLDDDLNFTFETTYKTDKVTMAGLSPLITCGGMANRPSEGQKTSASAALRATFLSLKPELTQTQLLDEYCSDVNTVAVKPLIDIIANVLGIQVILVTHQDIEFPLTYEVIKTGKISRVTKL